MASSSTPLSSTSLESALAGVPVRFRERIIARYLELRSAYSDGQHDSAGVRAGKFGEALLRFLQEELTGKHIAFNRRIGNLADECKKLEQLDKSSGEESLRLTIPRALNFLHTIRNKRGAAHEGGDVDANEIDAATCVRVADWCMCELMRLYNDLSLEEAQALLDAIATRQTSHIWSVAGKKRVLETALRVREQTLLLLYSDPETAVAAEDLSSWVEYSAGVAVFRRDVLKKLHTDRLVEHDRESDMVVLSPKGAEVVERDLLPKLERDST